MIATHPYSTYGYGPEVIVTTIANREAELSAHTRGMTPSQVRFVGDLATRLDLAEAKMVEEKRAIKAKALEATVTVGTAGGCGFIRGYYPDVMPAGFNPSLLIGLSAHGAALYQGSEAEKATDAKTRGELLEAEHYLEHAGNGGLSAYAFEEMQGLGARIRAAKAAKAAAAAP